MDATVDTYQLLRVLVDELYRSGVRHAVTSPGSRSTPLMLSLVRHGSIACHSQIDERAAGFFGLGLAKASRSPVVLACTSGTAAAEYLPAVVEAHEAGVPLIVLTADRPPELREVGAGQAIDQVGLFGRNVRWGFDFGTHQASTERLRWVRSLGCRLVHAATAGDRPGPVHLNVALREPLVLDGPLPKSDPVPGRRNGAPWLERPRASASLSPLPVGRRTVVVAGRNERDPGLPAAIRSYAEATGSVLLADPLSGARMGCSAIAHYDALLRHAPFAAAQQPDLVIRVGDLPTSKPLRTWLAGLDASIPQVGFACESTWADPDGVLHALLDGDPATSLIAAAGDAVPGEEGWRAAWRQADAAAAAAIEAVLAGEPLTEPQVARTLAAALPAEATFVVASSMPVRDLETFAPTRDDGGPRILANRGANGIDGTLATALGVAAAGDHVTVLLGDVAFAYDLSALLSVRRLGLALTMVVVDNGGGGIFDFLSVSTQVDAFEEHVATPTGLDVVAAAAALGLPPTEVRTAAQLQTALGASGSAAVIVRTSRAENVTHHREVWAAVAAVLT